MAIAVIRKRLKFISMESMAIHIMTQADLQDLRDIAVRMGSAKPVDYFETSLERQRQKKAALFIAAIGKQKVGYCILNFQPKYGLYKKLDIPEIQDLNVIPGYRRKGVGRALIEYCEKAAAEEGYSQAGISFGLHASYGAAQRLYVKMGYVPDGYGVTYDRMAVAAGEIRPVDDDLCLMMVKDLR